MRTSPHGGDITRPVAMIAVAALACCGRAGMPPELVNERRQEILKLVDDGQTRQAWEKYFELVNVSGVEGYPGVLLRIATATLEEGVRAPEPEVRTQALEALLYADDEFAFRMAAAGLEDEDPAVRSVAVDVLREAGRTEAVKLIEPQSKPLPAEERSAIESARLQAHESLRVHAFRALAALGVKSLPIAPLVNAMSSPDPDVRAAAAQALGELGNRDALPSLRYGLEEDIEWRVNAASAEALLKLGERKLVQQFAEAVAESEYAEKAVWAIDMRQYKGLGPGTQWILNEGTYKRAPEVRARAAIALGEMNVLEARPRLKEMLEHFEAVVRISAAYGLAALSDRSRIRTIVEAAENREPEVQAKAAAFLGALDACRYLGIFQRLQQDPDDRVRLQAVLALQHVEAGLALQHLAWSVGDGNGPVRFSASALIRGIWLAGSATAASQ